MPEWVELTKVNGEIEANVVAGSLDNEGIPTRLQKTAGVWRYGAADAFVLIAIYVPEERYEEAAALVAHPSGDQFAFDEAGASEPTESPDANPFPRTSSLRWWVAALVLAGLVLALFQSQVLNLLR